MAPNKKGEGKRLRTQNKLPGGGARPTNDNAPAENHDDVDYNGVAPIGDNIDSAALCAQAIVEIEQLEEQKKTLGTAIKDKMNYLKENTGVSKEAIRLAIKLRKKDAPVQKAVITETVNIMNWTDPQLQLNLPSQTQLVDDVAPASADGDGDAETPEADAGRIDPEAGAAAAKAEEVA